MKPLAMAPVFLAEFIGTALLLFLGCSGCVNWFGSPPSLLLVALNFGLVVMIVIQIFGCVSGAHINPAITVAAFMMKHISLPTAAIYVIGQTLGAFVGFGLLKVLMPQRLFDESAAFGGLCITMPHPEITVGLAFAVEFVASTCLVLMCCGVWDPRNANTYDSVGLRFGLGLTALAVSMVNKFNAIHKLIK